MDFALRRDASGDLLRSLALHAPHQLRVAQRDGGGIGDDGEKSHLAGRERRARHRPQEQHPDHVPFGDHGHHRDRGDALLVDGLANGIEQRMAARIVDHQRLACLEHLADLGVRRQIDAQLADHRVVARRHDPAGAALRVDEHQGTALHGEPAGELFHYLEEQPIRVPAGGEGARDIEQRGQVLRLPQHLVAVAARPRERTEQRRQIRRRVWSAHEAVEAVSDLRAGAGRKNPDQRPVALAGQRDELLAVRRRQIDDRRGGSGAAGAALQRKASLGKRLPKRFVRLREAQQRDCEWPLHWPLPLPQRASIARPGRVPKRRAEIRTLSGRPEGGPDRRRFRKIASWIGHLAV